ncbi:MAG: hypothetical protein ABR971_02990 [Acidobacteriaceae bacterium]
MDLALSSYSLTAESIDAVDESQAPAIDRDQFEDQESAGLS